eukprot:m.249732 g.249732  ORF g.249732 m.249732 type:complete len:65 (-) comp19089_c0_seq12:1009-1203(-)
MPAVVLVTGFEPFGEHAVNPSWEIAKTLSGLRIGDAFVVARELPVHYSKSTCQTGCGCAAVQVR